eukprot:TRINITY_DN3120_c0_g1_i1.p1 TRINITY_DN3120_c0_g1~~TRINITY_DN3120_c0_g1_i1.p1  ORF type:complete len:804 (-),score=167.33 TRINITY_DN3120_c0_g1_i1:61-2472(-)
MVFPLLKEDRYDGVSVTELVQRFGSDTMVFWYGALLGKRIIFCGSPAWAVCNCCLAVPLLAGPLTGFSSVIMPYISLPDIARILEKSTYICGVTNPIFETKTEWYDILGSFSTGVVSNDNIKPSSSDRQFMKAVLSGLQENKGESWVRQQFHNYTKDFLKALEEDKLRHQWKKFLTNFKENPIYIKYRAKLQPTEMADQRSPREFVLSLKNNPGAEVQDKTKLLFELQKQLGDLNALEEVCDADGVAVIATLLSESSAQLRKYSTAVLAQLANCLKGQIAMISAGLLPKLSSMINDIHPNVANGACHCLLQISQLYIGVHALIKAGVTEALFQIICSDSENLVLKTRATQTLQQIYQYAPQTPKPADISAFRKQQRSNTSDKVYWTALHQLFDLWQEISPYSSPGSLFEPSAAQYLPGLKAMKKISDEITMEDIETREQATFNLHSSLSREPEILLGLVYEDLVSLVVKNIKLVPFSHRLSRESFAILTIVADTTIGREKLIKDGVLPEALEGLRRANCPLYLFYVSRFLEVCCQHSNTATLICRYKWEKNDKLKLPSASPSSSVALSNSPRSSSSSNLSQSAAPSSFPTSSSGTNLSGSRSKGLFQSAASRPMGVHRSSLSNNRDKEKKEQPKVPQRQLIGSNRPETDGVPQKEHQLGSSITLTVPQSNHNPQNATVGSSNCRSRLSPQQTGVTLLVEHIIRYSDKGLLCRLCVPCLGAIKFILLFQQEFSQELVKSPILTPLLRLYKNTFSQKSSQPSLPSEAESGENVLVKKDGPALQYRDEINNLLFWIKVLIKRLLSS